MHFAAIAWILIGAVIAVYLAQIIRIWVALKELRKLPNLVVIHRGKRSQDVRARVGLTGSLWTRWAKGRLSSRRR